MCYETTLGTSPVAKFMPNLYVDITHVLERKKEALRELATQPKLPDNYEFLARFRGIEAQQTAWIRECVYAEAFCRIGTEAGG